LSKPPAVSRSARAEFTLRVISAVLLAVLALYVTWAGGRSFSLMCAVAGFLILVEYTRICGAVIPLRIRLTAFASFGLVVAAWFSGQSNLAMGIAGVAVLVLVSWEWLIARSLWGGAGFAYAALPFFALIALRESNDSGLVIILMLFASVWGADISAYAAGRLIGGPKLAPRLSPNKTWAGFFGSLAGGILLAYGLVRWFGFQPGVAFFGLVLGLAAVSQIGDLVESALKRRFGVKDSGTLIPGHGGVLDRIDGLIAAGVVLWLLGLALIWQQPSPASLPQILTDVFLLP